MLKNSQSTPFAKLKMILQKLDIFHEPFGHNKCGRLWVSTTVAVIQLLYVTAVVSLLLQLRRLRTCVYWVLRNCGQTKWHKNMAATSFISCLPAPIWVCVIFSNYHLVPTTLSHHVHVSTAIHIPGLLQPKLGCWPFLSQSSSNDKFIQVSSTMSVLETVSDSRWTPVMITNCNQISIMPTPIDIHLVLALGSSLSSTIPPVLGSMLIVYSHNCLTLTRLLYCGCEWTVFLDGLVLLNSSCV